MFYNKKKEPWFAKRKLERGFVAFVNRLRANHYNLGESLARKNLIDKPNCECGENIEDIDHYVLKCPLLSTEREALITDIERSGSRASHSVWTWIKEKRIIK